MKVFRYWKIILGLTLVFAAGAVSGGVATRYLLARGLSKALNFDHWKAGTMQVLQDKLKLSPDQHQKIEKLVDERGHEIRATFGTTFHQCGHIMVQLQHEIDQELTPQQREIHEEMKRGFRAELKKKFNFDLPDE